jgi:hypothetical protein
VMGFGSPGSREDIEAEHVGRGEPILQWKYGRRWEYGGSNSDGMNGLMIRHSAAKSRGLRTSSDWDWDSDSDSDSEDLEGLAVLPSPSESSVLLRRSILMAPGRPSSPCSRSLAHRMWTSKTLFL